MSSGSILLTQTRMVSADWEIDMEPVLTVCPDNCGVTGPAVYRAESHPLSCDWMMNRADRCSVHDELLRPDEPECPYPDTSDDDEDPHHRLRA